MPEPGEVLAGRYRLLEPLGEGGMGTVWRAEHVELGSQVAVKLISEGVDSSEATLARFRREAKAAAALSSPHVVQIFDYGVDKDIPYIAMEVLRGESLAQRLKVRGTLHVDQVVSLVGQIAKAVDKAHRAGVLHRDLKPDNVFICKDEDEDEIVKILDFGVAKTLKPDIIGTVSSHTRTGALVGSPYYMGPEQIRGQKNIDHRADLWSVGVMTFEALTGKRAFDGDSLGDLVMSVCSDPLPVPSERGCKLAGFDGWFAKACARQPDERFQSGREMANALRALVGQTVLDEDTRESVTDLSVPSGQLAAATSATAPGPAAPDASTLASAVAPVGSALPVATAPGLARTQGDDASAARRSVRTLALAVVAIALSVTAVAVVLLVEPWAGGSSAPSPATEPPAETDSAATATASIAAPTEAPSSTAAESASAPSPSTAADAAAPLPSTEPAAPKPTGAATAKAKGGATTAAPAPPPSP